MAKKLNKPAILNGIHQDGTSKICTFHTVRIDIEVANHIGLTSGGKYYLDENPRFKPIELESFIKEPELVAHVKEVVGHQYPQRQDPSFFVYNTWTIKNFKKNNFEHYAAVFFPQLYNNYALGSIYAKAYTYVKAL